MWHCPFRKKPAGGRDWKQREQIGLVVSYYERRGKEGVYDSYLTWCHQIYGCITLATTAVRLVCALDALSEQGAFCDWTGAALLIFPFVDR